MGRAIPRQHLAVVLRSRYLYLRALLAIAMVVIAALTVTVVVLATDDDRAASTVAPAQVSAPSSGGSVRYDGLVRPRCPRRRLGRPESRCVNRFHGYREWART
jgi:hypothetical protein